MDPPQTLQGLDISSPVGGFSRRLIFSIRQVKKKSSQIGTSEHPGKCTCVFEWSSLSASWRRWAA